MASPLLNRLLMIDPSTPPKKIKKRWNTFDFDDPNLEINRRRAGNGLPPIDLWNIGVEYTYKRIL
jgi:hypothetical protein